MRRARFALLAPFLLLVSATTGCAALDQAEAWIRGEGACSRDDAGAALPDVDSDAVVTWREDAQRTGYAPQARLPRAVDLAWTLPNVNPGNHSAAKGSVVQAPNGFLLVGGDDGRLRALTPEGEEVWNATTGPSRNGIHGTPAIADGLAFIGAYDGVLYAFRVTDGALVWCTKLGDSIGASPLYHDGRVFIMVETYRPSGIFAVVDARTGDALHLDRDIPDHPHSSLALDPATGVVVAGANDGVLYAWNATTYARAWTVQTGSAIKGPVTVFDGLAIAGSWDNHVYAVETATGDVAWRFEAKRNVMSGAAVHPDSRTVFIGSHDYRVYALDADSGDVKWTYRTGGSIIGSPTVTRDGLVVGAYDAHVYALDLDGNLLWKWQAAGQVTSSPLVLPDGTVLFAERAREAPGALYALAPAP